MHIHIMHIRAYPGISIQECLDVHTGMSNSHQIWMSTGYCMTILCQICIRINFEKKPNSRYDYMHIRILSGFISENFNISGQHWLQPSPYTMQTSSGFTLDAMLASNTNENCFRNSLFLFLHFLGVCQKLECPLGIG
jgi:hypothetical protein